MNELKTTLSEYFDKNQVQQIVQGIQIGLPIVIYGSHKPTGKTTLCKTLRELGVNAVEAWEIKEEDSNTASIAILLNQFRKECAVRFNTIYYHQHAIRICSANEKTWVSKMDLKRALGSAFYGLELGFVRGTCHDAFYDETGNQVSVVSVNRLKQSLFRCNEEIIKNFQKWMDTEQAFF